MRRLANVLAAVTGNLWAIDPGKLDQILAMLSLHAHDGRLTDAEIRAAVGKEMTPTPAPTAPQWVAVIPIVGVILPRATGIQESSGLMSLARISAQFDAAMRDPAVGSIVLDIDSPGGMVAGVPEFAAKVSAARETKPVLAIANTLAASAGYWIAAAAETLIASPSADVGSIGVLTVHLDESRANEAEGLSYTVLAAGEFKGEGNPFEPLGDLARAHIQERLGDAYGMFLAAVAKGRGTTVAAVRDSYGRGRVLSARKALAAGMVDRIATLDDVLAKLSSGRGRASLRPSSTASSVLPAAALTFTIPALDLGDSLEAGRADSFDAIRLALDALRSLPNLLGREPASEDPPAGSSGSSPVVVSAVPAPTLPAGPAEETRMSAPAVPVATGADPAAELLRARAALARHEAFDHLRRTYPEQAGPIDAALTAGKPVDDAKDDILKALRAGQVQVGGPNTSGALPNAATKPFTSFGEQVVAIVQAGKPGGRMDVRLQHSNASVLQAASGLNEAIGSEGGYFIAPTLLPGVIDPVYNDDPLLSRVTRIPMSGNSIVYNVVEETSRATGSRWGGIQMYWVAEAGTATEKKPAMRQVRLALKKIMGVGYLTEELMEDAPAAEALLTRAFQTELRFMLGDAIFRGSGAGMPLGFLTGAGKVEQAIEATQTIANSNTFIATNIAKMLTHVPAHLWGSVIFLYNQELLPTFITAVIGTSTIPVFIGAGGLAQQPADTLLGRPAFGSELCEAVGTPGDLIAIVPSEYHMSDKGGVNAVTSVHVRFLFDEQTLKITYRADGQPLWHKSVTPYKGAAARSPYVTLGTRA